MKYKRLRSLRCSSSSSSHNTRTSCEHSALAALARSLHHTKFARVDSSIQKPYAPAMWLQFRFRFCFRWFLAAAAAVASFFLFFSFSFSFRLFAGLSSVFRASVVFTFHRFYSRTTAHHTPPFILYIWSFFHFYLYCRAVLRLEREHSHTTQTTTDDDDDVEENRTYSMVSRNFRCCDSIFNISYMYIGARVHQCSHNFTLSLSIALQSQFHSFPELLLRLLAVFSAFSPYFCQRWPLAIRGAQTNLQISDEEEIKKIRILIFLWCKH